MRFFGRQKRWALGVSLLLGLAGCAEQRAKFAWPFAQPKDEMPGITTPEQRIEQLKTLVASASRSTPQEQERVSTDLAHQIQREEDPLVRRQIILTLSAYPTTMASAVIHAGMADTDADVRIACCKAWGRRGGTEAVEQLSRALASDTNIDVRLAAARALGQTKDPSAAAPLGDALADADPALQYRAIESLKAISGRDFGNDLAAWRQYAKTGHSDKPLTVAERLRGLF